MGALRRWEKKMVVLDNSSTQSQTTDDFAENFASGGGRDLLTVFLQEGPAFKVTPMSQC